MIQPPQKLDASILRPTQPKPLSAKDAMGRPVTFDPRQPEEAPEWARLFVEAHNRSVDAIESLSRAQKNTRKVIEFRTKDPVESTFPMFVAFSPQPIGLHIIRPRNLDVPATLFYEHPVVDFSFAPGGVTVRYISGLSPLVRYALTLEAVYA